MSQPEQIKFEEIKTELPLIIEALLFATPDPLSPEDLHRIIGAIYEVPISWIYDALKELKIAYLSRAYEIKEVAGGLVLQTKESYAPFLEQLNGTHGRAELSPQALEVLSIITYRQPITRSEIDEIRGVESSHLVQQLIERNLIEPKGRKETVGRPTLFATSKNFLKLFGLKSLEELFV